MLAENDRQNNYFEKLRYYAIDKESIPITLSEFNTADTLPVLSEKIFRYYRDKLLTEYDNRFISGVHDM